MDDDNDLTCARRCTIRRWWNSLFLTMTSLYVFLIWLFLFFCLRMSRLWGCVGDRTISGNRAVRFIWFCFYSIYALDVLFPYLTLSYLSLGRDSLDSSTYHYSSYIEYCTSEFIPRAFAKGLPLLDQSEVTISDFILTIFYGLTAVSRKRLSKRDLSFSPTSISCLFYWLFLSLKVRSKRIHFLLEQ